MSKDSAGETFKQLVPFDLGNWENTSQYISPYTNDVANAIEKVAGKLEQMTRRNSREGNMGQSSPEVNALKRIADALEQISTKK